ncbi:MAG: hypothetical protein GX981_00990 [Tissierellia bacterium]|nr:hypothetical protein [Tissierellia bacterium]
MGYFTKKEQLVIIFLILVIIIISLLGFLKKNILKSSTIGLDHSISTENLLMEIEDKLEDEDNEDSIIMVHISGEVYKPGLVELKPGQRVIDAVELAGGLKKDADIDKINLAKKLVDEEKIYIPKIGEEEIPVELNSEISNDGSNSNGKININIAPKEQLMTLPGIGEVLAGRIVEYRENTPFKSIEDIKNVSGIGDKKFEGIKDLITIR